MKSVLISIQPQWCELIAAGKKILEVRKTRPKLETPFKCYIYCTLSGSKEFYNADLDGDVAEWNRGKWSERKGNVIGEFVCDNTVCVDVDNCKQISAESCLPLRDMWKYARPKSLYDLKAWHISNLKIYDMPKELSEFRKACGTQNCDGCQFWENTGEYAGCLTSEERRLRRPPQSWCYVKEV